MLKFRLKTVKENLMEPTVYKFYLFLILQGFMPTFVDFNYYFAIEVLKISKFTIGFATVLMGIMIVVGPIFYQKYLRDSEFRSLFMCCQIIHVTQNALILMQALRINKPLGRWSDIFLYILTGSFANVLERLLTMIPSFIIMAKIIPPGVEAFMVSISMTIITLNQFTMRQILGTFINSRFVGVTNDTIERYWVLALIETIFKLLPFIYIYFLCPRNSVVHAL